MAYAKTSLVWQERAHVQLGSLIIHKISSEVLYFIKELKKQKSFEEGENTKCNIERESGIYILTWL